MTVLEWDKTGERVYESGLDRGVLYLPDGSAVPWNGLLEVNEKPEAEANSVYFDGMKINHLVNRGSFVGTMKAITYPDEFIEMEGLSAISLGMYFGEQPHKMFGLSWRTKIGTDLGEDSGYKLHVLYNVSAMPNEKTYATITDDPNIANFQWDIVAIPEEVEGFKPTAHVIIDSRYIDPAQLEDIEAFLYGTEGTDASLVPISSFVNYLYFGYQWKIIDNGDGTWTAITPIEGLVAIDPVDPDKWTLNDVNATYLTTDVYTIDDMLA